MPGNEKLCSSWEWLRNGVRAVFSDETEQFRALFEPVRGNEVAKDMDYNQVKAAASAKIARQSVVIGDVTIGENSCVLYFSVLRGDEAPIRIGEATNIQENCTLHTSRGCPVEIGDYVTVGHNVVLHGCQIGDGSLIGMGSVILDGAKIGKQCLIGAGSLVTKNMVIPDGSLVMGSPAKIKRELTEEEKRHLYSNSMEYVMASEEMWKNGVLR